MADKRTTPEAPPEGAPQAAPEGPRRNKRAAPTIDLTATEVPPAQPAAPSQPEPPPATNEPPAGSAGGEPPNTVAKRPAGSIAMAALAGAAGAATVLLILLTLWLSGLVPLRYAASIDTTSQVAMDTTAIDALTQRVSKIEESIKKPPISDAAVAARLTAAESATKSLGVTLAELNRRGDDIAATANQARERADAAQKAVTELRASVQDAAKNSSAGISPSEFDALQKRVASLEQSAKIARADIAKASSADMAARLALSAAALRDAVTNGVPFADELAQLKSLGGDQKALAALAPFATTGVPTAPALAQELHALLPAMLQISSAAAPEGGFLERLQANAGKLVRVRPVTAPSGDDPSAVLAHLEIDASKADIAAALSDLGKLDSATRAPAQAWIAKAQARQAALDAARNYAVDTARALGSKAGVQ
jgi:hypothetical protein